MLYISLIKCHYYVEKLFRFDLAVSLQIELLHYFIDLGLPLVALLSV